MAGKEHRYAVTVEWTGNRGEGTSSYKRYERAHELRAEGKPTIPGSSDPAFRGDPARWNPEELLVASLSACHKLWYLHLCATAGVVVTDYVDDAEGVMAEEADGGGRFVRVVLRPRVTITAGSDRDKAQALHHEAHALCFIARSVSFPVTHEPTTLVAAARA
ncbi:OsmC family protein [Myxococcus sp. RHSTA-1-4]|uniref:OsmC family protein n=1 Tax=Myxococcus sp. RHSTA-1-4 TaxID=2874601 RepID=UPI001CC0EAB8|nr:OsmC family protein [Myxococcus sp. RHSTA-1-4]MBZ4418385.1 OsmC family protein [Myxococcus sp. RHSTA-1-4]